MVVMGSANRDERVYPNPDAFDLFRNFTNENKVLMFGEGINSCMGAPIARLTARVLLEELGAGVDESELRIVGMPERWAKQMVRGFANLPVKIVSSDVVVQVRKPHTSAAHVGSVQQRTTRAHPRHARVRGCGSS